ncbi:MAG: YbaB/EbfC family nucleoid-associated protein [Planctomycetes bacterium]|nr:YbaB/EbfC family nucleoid-associated protein [Planctomycetota bacterium]
MARGFDPNELMNQARKMKDQMARVQEQLKERVVEGSAGGGMVTVFVNGGSEVVGIKLKKDVVDPDDVSMLEDLIQVAVNDGLRKAQELSEQEMGKVTGGLGGLGGLF